VCGWHLVLAEVQLETAGEIVSDAVGDYRAVLLDDPLGLNALEQALVLEQASLRGHLPGAYRCSAVIR
jgi:hypothetical protein